MELKDLLGENFSEDMTVEDINKALAEIKLPADRTDELAKLKKAIDNATKDASEWKKKYNDTLSEADKQKAEEEEKRKELEANYNALLKRTQVADYTSKYLALGYSAERANKCAVALSEGNFDDLFTFAGEHIKEIEQTIKTKLMDSAPKPKGSEGGTKLMSKAEFYKLSTAERMKFANEHPEEYKQINGG